MLAFNGLRCVKKITANFHQTFYGKFVIGYFLGIYSYLDSVNNKNRCKHPLLKSKMYWTFYFFFFF